MTQVTLKLYHSDGAAREHDRVLVETRRIETESAKPLTAKRAAQVIAREYPRFKSLTGVRVITTEEGWRASRSLRPTAKCGFHYIWEEVYVFEG